MSEGLNKNLTIGQLIRTIEEGLVESDVKTARLDSLVMVESVSGKDRGWLLSHSDQCLTATQIKNLTKLFIGRKRDYPLAYLLSYKEFYGRNFVINSKVLVPRPETETMIDLFKELVNHDKNSTLDAEKWLVADIGCGCGAIGITVALEASNCEVELIDIDKSALSVAKTNVENLTLNLKTICSDLLASTSKKYDILLCNLPYVPDDFPINKAAMYEPKLALFGGKDGLDLYRKLFNQLEDINKKPLYILIEAFSSQHETIEALSSKYGYSLEKSVDFIQIYKFSD